MVQLNKNLQKASFWTRKYASGLCPCDSGKFARKCCYTKDNCWQKKNTIIALPGDSTSFSHKKCIFKSHKNCSGKISKEHYFSRSILGQFEWNSTTLEGFPWLAKNGCTPSVNSLVANILCERHNNALSCLDNSAGDVFTKLKLIGNWEETREFYITSGADFERWMLKALCGAIAAKIVRLDKSATINTCEINDHWLDILIGKEDFSGTMGLYVEGGIGHKIEFANEFGFAPLFNNGTEKQVVGASFSMAGLIFK